MTTLEVDANMPTSCRRQLFFLFFFILSLFSYRAAALRPRLTSRFPHARRDFETLIRSSVGRTGEMFFFSRDVAPIGFLFFCFWLRRPPLSRRWSLAPISSSERRAPPFSLLFFSSAVLALARSLARFFLSRFPPYFSPNPQNKNAIMTTSTK